MDDFLFHGDLAEVDPDVAQLAEFEAERQARKLILIPSESSAPQAVLQAVGSVFHNIYAEGYPSDHSRNQTEAEILDYAAELGRYRRLADKRFYKGVEYADVAEALARRRCAVNFAANGLTPDDLLVNVQALSGAPANNAVYTALVQPGDTVMGMDLLHGGHLTHGSKANRSGKLYNIISYGINAETERLDYEAIAALAEEHRPKMIIGGFSSYPWAPDWAIFREIADSVGAYLFADIAHVAGLTAAGVYPNPVGIADVVTFTTHKTLMGPRGAVIITHRPELASKIDRAVFPGEQGGPHMNAVLGLAVAMGIADTGKFRELQQQIIANATRMADRLAERGFRVPYGGTDTHMFLVDCKSVVADDGSPLTGDVAARILDLVGIVVNRNTIPGDTSALRPTGIRLGTPWITQRGLREPESERLADIIADVLLACQPYAYHGARSAQWSAKVDWGALQQARQMLAELADEAGIDFEYITGGYPHFHAQPELSDAGWASIEITGPQAHAFVSYSLTSDPETLEPGARQPTQLLNPDGSLLAAGWLERPGDSVDAYRLHVESNGGQAIDWLRALSDGYVALGDGHAAAPGPVVVNVVESPDWVANESSEAAPIASYKPYWIGLDGSDGGGAAEARALFSWEEVESEDLQRTSLYELHKDLGAKMVPFAGWDMPVWYSSVSEEHAAVRHSSGLFDVSHMGVFDATGPGAETFLNTITTNDVSLLAPGQAQYSYLLAPNGSVIDDIYVYRLEPERFMLVVNASNNDKDWTWLAGVQAGDYAIDENRPWAAPPAIGQVTLRNLRDLAAGDQMRVDIALQGPRSLEILLSLAGDEGTKVALQTLPWSNVMVAELGGFDLIVSRTGYTGERVAFELFVHPDRAPALFETLVDAGAVPCGLAARDSTRTEAGLPLYGHELAGPLALGPADAGFGGYVKTSKPFFVGRTAFLAHEATREGQIVRFRMDDKGVRMPTLGDPVVDRHGRVVGTVTSCAIDGEGYLSGQAYVREDYAAPGTRVGIFQTGGRARTEKPKNELEPGDRVQLHDSATVLRRFPKRK
jgi:glycine hydroxymethyltransferase